MSSAGIQKLFCGIYSAFKCSFDEFVGEKVVSPSYSSTMFLPSPFSFIIVIDELLEAQCGPRLRDRKSRGGPKMVEE